jgi:hypothetical protein
LYVDQSSPHPQMDSAFQYPKTYLTVPKKLFEVLILPFQFCD